MVKHKTCQLSSRAMSLLRYFKRKDPASEGIFVPVANDGATASANVCVGDPASEPPCKRSKTHQHSYDAKTRAQIGEYTYNNGPAAASLSLRRGSFEMRT